MEKFLHPKTQLYVQSLRSVGKIELDKKFDFVLSLEFEHIPKKYEKTFIDNIHRHNERHKL